MALGVNWADGVWDEAIWDNAVWAQTGTDAVDQFTFTDRPGQAQSAANVESGNVTLLNVLGTQDVAFSGDASLEWSKNDGTWSTGATTVESGDTMNLRLDASASYLTQVSGTMTVGTGGQAVSDVYSVTTIPDPTVTDSIVAEDTVVNITRGISRKING